VLAWHYASGRGYLIESEAEWLSIEESDRPDTA
jgi:hypothetical protein